MSLGFPHKLIKPFHQLSVLASLLYHDFQSPPLPLSQLVAANLFPPHQIFEMLQAE